MQKNKKRAIAKGVLYFVICFFGFVIPASAEVAVADNKNLTFNILPYLRTDVVTLKNNIGLDSRNKDDSSTYFGVDYSLGFDLKFKDSGPEAYLKLERNGPYDYDAPLFIRNTLRTSTAQAERYRGNELLPHVEEFWYDTPLFELPLRLKSGLFAYHAANDLAVPASYENYSLSLYRENENLKWHFYYCKPDLVNKSYLGPRIKQEREQGIHYTPNKANFFATDAVFTFKNNSLQPYVEVLSDGSGDSRANLFSTPTHNDLLGTLGLAWNSTFDKLSIAIETARNFGKVQSSDENFKDVEHCGYLLYADAAYNFERIIPHSRFVLASGNKVTTDMVDNGDEVLTSGKNRAFSAYSPFNTNLLDSIYPDANNLPLVAMGAGNGLNYGINRPTTFGDPRLFVLDWWYLRAMERGVGTFEGSSKMLSPDLGNELDLSFNYELNKNITLGLLSGCFLPGRYYKEDRDDTEGSLFTPFVRGDGEADPAYQIELSCTLTF
ncbi:MAG: hypothetical protein NTU54_02235 [Candidatus Omnitrophica bacterium]|nr:hypothetical protein [Candidatus Omnitrophota bacterium]